MSFLGCLSSDKILLDESPKEPIAIEGNSTSKIHEVITELGEILGLLDQAERGHEPFSRHGDRNTLSSNRHMDDLFFSDFWE